MYIVDGIAYAGEAAPILKVTDVKPLPGYRLQVSFNSGEEGIADCSELLDSPAFKPLADENLFASVTLERGVPIWLDGEVDLSPAWLYQKSAFRLEPGSALSA